ncbi:hypothetical protein [Rhodococcoides kyotonense]|uniref:Uncharacterized protein n=1 Tax=Rhodococcoides kyotonense TaxID=398843 RepID=A0A239IPL9_9NOCA|nr:hypothetical protein [Rhodococcus kyotonensis]SNS94364.1 hypothetical protein SAMN05421642_107114 [Rhodococcus kyotonensis]
MTAVSEVPRSMTDQVDGWHVSLGENARFDRVENGSTIRSITGPGLAEFDSFVHRFAPSSYDDAAIRSLIADHLGGRSPLSYRVPDRANLGILVGASYKTTIDEVLGAVWEACCSAVIREAMRAEIDQFVVHCNHVTAESVEQFFGAGERKLFVESMRPALDDVAQVVRRG